MSLICDSWKAGKRLPVDECWPDKFVPENYQSAVIAALTDAGFIDRTGRIPEESWEEWYGQAEAWAEQHRVKSSRGGTTRALNEKRRLVDAIETSPPAELTDEQKAEVAAAKEAISALTERLGKKP